MTALRSKHVVCVKEQEPEDFFLTQFSVKHNLRLWMMDPRGIRSCEKEVNVQTYIWKILQINTDMLGLGCHSDDYGGYDILGCNHS